ncbi:CvpA family protein [Thermoanaerobacterium butyriciformans]|uniref:Membrane protein required for colicin V production n=1 Tax=Thermoanaerobacterium butyriciformans TaxID=1702242 RepID=A0ABS4NEJ5_9THEO|nr:CvpA family protein [Thermoanaerobacterium butyriciformans]MBP2072096.1 putative membrane protein required for colicin V production [Thermoanaerobacterium butyriciformans]
MNIVDVLIVLIISYFIYSGFISGFIMTLYGLANIVISWILTVKFYPIVSQYIMGNVKLLDFVLKLAGSLKNVVFNVTSIKSFVDLISIVLIFLFFTLFLKIFAVILNKLLNYPFIRIFNKIAGGLLGMVEGFAFVFFIFSLFKVINNMLPLSYWAYIDKSQFAKLFLNNNDVLKMFLL